MSDLRLLLVLPLIIPMFVGVIILYIFGLPFLIIGGKKAIPMFEAITSLISD